MNDKFKIKTFINTKCLLRRNNTYTYRKYIFIELNKLTAVKIRLVNFVFSYMNRFKCNTNY